MFVDGWVSEDKATSSSVMGEEKGSCCDEGIRSNERLGVTGGPGLDWAGESLCQIQRGTMGVRGGPEIICLLDTLLLVA